MTPAISILIPHRNDSEKLELCIKALTNQSYPREYFEIIVIDNDSDTVHKENVDKLPGLYEIKLLNQPIQSSYAARNLGLKHARGEYIAFTDSDCIPDADWIKNGLECLENKDIIGGRINLFYKNPENPNTVELFEKIYSFRQNIFINKYHYSATANLITHSYILEDVGYFNEEMKSNGDREWCLRARQKGHIITYCDSVIVNHPARNSFRDFTRRQLRLCGGGYNIRKQSGRSSLTLFLINIFTAVPPVATIYKVFGNKDFRISKTGSKIKLICLIVYIKYLRVYETFRLSLGFNPRNY